MAVGKGSMDRASKAVKNTEKKAAEGTGQIISNILEEQETATAGNKTEQEASVKKTSSKKKVSEKKPASKKTSVKNETVSKEAEEVKTTVIAATNEQVLNLVEKAQDEKENEKQKATPSICAIGDEMPVHFL